MFEEANADSYIVSAHVKPPEIGSRPSMKVNDNTAVSPQWCNRGKSPGGQGGAHRMLTKSGRYGMAGWSGTASLAPR